MLLTVDALLSILNLGPPKYSNTERVGGEILRIDRKKVTSCLGYSDCDLLIEFNEVSRLVTKFSIYSTFYRVKHVGKKILCSRKRRNIISLKIEKGLNFKYTICSFKEDCAHYILTDKGEVIHYSDINGNEYKKEWGTPFPYLDIGRLIHKTLEDGNM
jgi:hypothetical protein